MSLLKNRVAVVTGAGAGIGRAHALALARAGAKVVVNDVNDLAREVVEAIVQEGGEAAAHIGSVADWPVMEALAATTRNRWGGIDILVNNAGILRDRSFAKMSLDEFRQVLDVHVMGAVHATQAVWPIMQEQRYGRVVMTTSSSGLYGNFGQANYGAAKMALVGLMQTLAIEGQRYGIKVNCLAPSAVTTMTSGMLPAEASELLTPERVSPALIALVADAAPDRTILLAGAGSFECAHITMTEGIHLPEGQLSAEAVLARMAEIQATNYRPQPANGWDQPQHELAKAKAGG